MNAVAGGVAERPRLGGFESSSLRRNPRPVTELGSPTPTGNDNSTADELPAAGTE
jgi:hypothetical protein